MLSRAVSAQDEKRAEKQGLTLATDEAGTVRTEGLTSHYSIQRGDVPGHAGDERFSWRSDEVALRKSWPQ